MYFQDSEAHGSLSFGNSSARITQKQGKASRSAEETRFSTQLTLFQAEPPINSARHGCLRLGSPVCLALQESTHRTVNQVGAACMKRDGGMADRGGVQRDGSLQRRQLLAAAGVLIGLLFGLASSARAARRRLRGGRRPSGLGFEVPSGLRGSSRRNAASCCSATRHGHTTYTNSTATSAPSTTGCRNQTDRPEAELIAAADFASPAALLALTATAAEAASSFPAACLPPAAGRQQKSIRISERRETAIRTLLLLELLCQLR
jgi:hypothetical protein